MVMSMSFPNAAFGYGSSQNTGQTIKAAAGRQEILKERPAYLTDFKLRSEVTSSDHSG